MSRWNDRRAHDRPRTRPWRDLTGFQAAVESLPLRAEWTLVGAGVLKPGDAAAAFADEGLTAEMFTDPSAAAAMAYIVEHRGEELIGVYEIAQTINVPPQVIDYACEHLSITRIDAPDSARRVRLLAAQRALGEAMDAVRADLAAGHDPAPESLARLTEAAQKADPLEEDRRMRIEDGAAAAVRALPPPDTVLADCFEMGDKVDIVAPSKSRKTWFTVSLAVHLAAGREFLGMGVPKARRVLYVNLEIKRDDFDRRLQRTLQAYGIEADALGERLGLMSARGKGPEIRQRIIALARRFRAEVVVIDPQYKLLKPEEDENAGSGIADILRLKDNIAEETGAAVVAVMHDGKGVSGDRDIRDRGAGSSWTARDFDTRFALTPQADNPESMLVLAVLCRNHPPSPDRVIEFAEGRFEIRDGVAAEAETARTRERRADEERRMDKDEAIHAFLAAQTRLDSRDISRHTLAARLAVKYQMAERTAANFVTRFQYRLPADIATVRGPKNELFFRVKKEETFPNV